MISSASVCAMNASKALRTVSGAPVAEQVRAPLADPHLAMDTGDWVSLHWGWACDRLSPRQVARLARSTAAALALANERI